MTHAPLALASAISLALVATTELAAPRPSPVVHLAGCAKPTVGGVGAVELPAASTGRLLVANQQSASATIVDLAAGEVHHLPLPGAHPHGAAISPDGRRCPVRGSITSSAVAGIAASTATPATARSTTAPIASMPAPAGSAPAAARTSTATT
jgi:hypothetical protein